MHWTASSNEKMRSRCTLQCRACERAQPPHPSGAEVVVKQDACAHLRSATRGTPMLMAAAMALLLCLVK
jgi:hypothetical protein